MTTPHRIYRAVLLLAGIVTVGSAFLAVPAWAAGMHPLPHTAPMSQHGRAWNFTVIPRYQGHGQVPAEAVTAKVAGYPRSWHSVHWSIYTKAGHRVVGSGQVPLTSGSGSQTIYSVPARGRFVAAYTRPNLTTGRTYFVTNCDNTC